MKKQLAVSLLSVALLAPGAAFAQSTTARGAANGAGATAGAGFVVADPPSRRSQAPLHGPGESYSDLILRLAEIEARGPVSSR